jgi:hypothetical protein
MIDKLYSFYLGDSKKNITMGGEKLKKNVISKLILSTYALNNFPNNYTLLKDSILNQYSSISLKDISMEFLMAIINKTEMNVLNEYSKKIFDVIIVLLKTGLKYINR